MAAGAGFFVTAGGSRPTDAAGCCGLPPASGAGCAGFSPGKAWRAGATGRVAPVGNLPFRAVISCQYRSFREMYPWPSDADGLSGWLAVMVSAFLVESPGKKTDTRVSGPASHPSPWQLTGVWHAGVVCRRWSSPVVGCSQSSLDFFDPFLGDLLPTPQLRNTRGGVAELRSCGVGKFWLWGFGDLSSSAVAGAWGAGFGETGLLLS